MSGCEWPGMEMDSNLKIFGYFFSFKIPFIVFLSSLKAIYIRARCSCHKNNENSQNGHEKPIGLNQCITLVAKFGLQLILS